MLNVLSLPACPHVPSPRGRGNKPVLKLKLKAKGMGQIMCVMPAAKVFKANAAVLRRNKPPQVMLCCKLFSWCLQVEAYESEISKDWRLNFRLAKNCGKDVKTLCPSVCNQAGDGSVSFGRAVLFLSLSQPLGHVGLLKGLLGRQLERLLGRLLGVKVPDAKTWGAGVEVRGSGSADVQHCLDKL